MSDLPTYVISDPCIGSVDKSCVEVCPVDCIYEVGNDPEKPDEAYLLVIDPEECISCGACEPECPVEAIHIIDNVPEKWKGYIEVNAMHTGRGDNDGPAEDDREDKQDIADKAKELHDALTASVD